MFLLELCKTYVSRTRQKRKRYIDWESYYPYKMHLFLIQFGLVAIPKKLCKKSSLSASRKNYTFITVSA